MSKTFYETTKSLDRITSTTKIDPERVTEIIEIIKEPKFTKYFFENLDTGAWIPALHKEKLFYSTPPPVEDLEHRGSFRLPFWYAGEYLKKFAKEFPTILVEIALTIRTDNARAFHDLLGGLLSIRPDEAATAVEAFDYWQSGPFAKSMFLAHEMGLLMGEFAKAKLIDTSLKVLKVLTNPISEEDQYEKAHFVATTKGDPYWIKKALNENLPYLISKDPLAVVNLLESQLRTAIDLEKNPDVSRDDLPKVSYWRLNIAPTSDSFPREDLKNLLVNQIVIGLLRSSDLDREETAKILKRFLQSSYAI